MARIIADLHPKLQTKVAELIKRCEKEGLQVKITSCIRNEVEQLDCFKRKTSTLLYPNSMHNWGVAFDFCRNDGTGAYNDSDGFFAKVGKIGQSIGLIWGGSWTKPDKPHFQLADWGISTSKLKSMYGAPEKFITSWKTSSSPSKPVAPKPYTYKTMPSVKTNDEWVRKVQMELEKDKRKGANGRIIIVDGYAGPQTAYAFPTIKRGNKNKYVRLVQERLKELGYDPKGIDGVYGKNPHRGMYDAVIAYKKNVLGLTSTSAKFSSGKEMVCALLLGTK